MVDGNGWWWMVDVKHEGLDMLLRSIQITNSNSGIIIFYL